MVIFRRTGLWSDERSQRVINGKGIWNAFDKSKINSRAAIIVMVSREGRSYYIVFGIIGEILKKGNISINMSAIPIPMLSIKVSENNRTVA